MRGDPARGLTRERVVSRETPAAAVAVFGDRLGDAERYVALLAGDGIERGLIGPREQDRLWERHVLNSAAVADVVPIGLEVLDVGSGAGLPGIPLALARPDLTVVLLEPLLRRATFLGETVEALHLADRVRVVRARAEDVAGTVDADVVTSRALAPLARVVQWCLPLTRPHGFVAALKGASAPEEIERDAAVVEDLGGTRPHVVRCGSGAVGSAAHVVVVHRRSAGGRDVGDA